MRTEKELTGMIIDRCHKASACEDQFKQLLSVKDNAVHFVRVLLNNHSWCIDNKIYTSEFIREFDPEILRRAGLLTQDTAPVDFNPVEIGGLLWDGLNYGATKESPNGSYHTFDEAQELSHGKRPASWFENSLLLTTPSLWGAYADGFGMVFKADGGNLYIPAAGYREASNGTFYLAGYYGWVWSSSPYSTANGCNLRFGYNGGVNPSNNNYRGYGLSVRPVQELPSAKRA